MHRASIAAPPGVLSPVSTSQIWRHHGPLQCALHAIVNVAEGCWEAAVLMFRNQEPNFWQWVYDHPEGYVLERQGIQKQRSSILHRADCPAYTTGVGSPPGHVEFCSTDVSELVTQAAKDKVGFTPCSNRRPPRG